MSRDGAPEPSVHVEGLRKTYGEITALDGIDLDLQGPRIVGLVGPNGAGKTTLIKVLLNLVAADEGRARVFGRAPDELFEPGGPRVGYMPQGLAVYPDLTVRQNVAFFARLHQVRSEDLAGAVASAVASVDLSHRIDDRVVTLSGGMQRRVSLACSLVHEPAFAVLDEPTVGVDPDLRAQMWDRFRALRDDGGLLLMSTHYLGEAGRCDLVVFLRQGRVLAVDEPRLILESTGTEDLEEAFLALAHPVEVVA